MIQQDVNCQQISQQDRAVICLIKHPAFPLALGGHGDSTQLFLHLIQLCGQRAGAAGHCPSVHLLRHTDKGICIQSGREAGQRKPVFAQPLNTCKVLFSVPKTGGTGAENELLLQLVLFLVFCHLHSAPAVIVSWRVLLILETKLKSALQSGKD